MEVVDYMIVNRNFARFLGIAFALEFIVFIGFVLRYFISDFHFSGNYIVRIVFLVIVLFVALVFYTYISLDSEISEKTCEDRGWFIIKGDIEYFKLISIIIVFGVFLVFLISLILNIFNVV